MARLPRYVIPGQPQHIIQRGNNRQAIFGAEEDYTVFSETLAEAAERFDLKIHAYVWMTNHVHLLATPMTEQSISKTFQSAGRKYVQYFNHMYQRSGTLWEGRYRATVVDSARYLLILMRYIELNPVRAGMVADPGDYRWSSYRRNALAEDGKHYDWIVPHHEFLRLGTSEADRCGAYRALFTEVIDQNDLRTIRDNTHKGWAMGDSRFQDEIAALSKRRAAAKAAGRPKREKIGV